MNLPKFFNENFVYFITYILNFLRSVLGSWSQLDKFGPLTAYMHQSSLFPPRELSSMKALAAETALQSFSFRHKPAISQKE